MLIIVIIPHGFIHVLGVTRYTELQLHSETTTKIMGEVEETRKMLEDFSLNLAYGTHRVEVVHINNPQDFYARPVIYKKYEHKVYKHNSQADSVDLRLNAQVVYKSKVKLHCIRGEIRHNHESDELGFDIFATDYGFIEEKVTKQDIYEIDPNVNIPSLILPCSLSEALPREQFQTTWDDKAIEAFKYYIGLDEAVMKVVGKKDDKYLVELSNKYFQDVAEILAMTSYSVLGIGCNVVNRECTQKTKKQIFIFKELQKDQKVHVRVLSGKSLEKFYVADVEEYKNYLEERHRFRSFSKQSNFLKEDDLREGKPVSVYSDYDNMHFRGIIQNILDPCKVLVSFIDTGITKEVHFTRIKEMPDNFFVTPAVAIQCAAIQDQINDYQYEKLLYPGTQFYITVTKSGFQHQTPNIVRIWNTKILR